MRKKNLSGNLTMRMFGKNRKKVPLFVNESGHSLYGAPDLFFLKIPKSKKEDFAGKIA